jgi:hypothetical protein
LSGFESSICITNGGGGEIVEEFACTRIVDWESGRGVVRLVVNQKRDG